jgi:3-hydroxyisobutyrate/3-hydroxypropionate dehydrogenase
MLPSSGLLSSVYLEETGILAGAVAAAKDAPPQAKLIMECGTIENDTIAAVAKATQATSSSQFSETVTFVDAPVSGGPHGSTERLAHVHGRLSIGRVERDFPTGQVAP